MNKMEEIIAASKLGEMLQKKQQEEKKDGVRHNWVTDIYDKMNISVRSLDIALIVLCAIVVFCFIYGANH